MIIAATGHRPHKLGRHYPIELVAFARDFLRDAGDVRGVISGMALGWDTAWALAALQLGIPLTAAVPFASFDSHWAEADRRIYVDILQRAESVELICKGGYERWKLQRRNEWMVDNADRVVALWDGSPSGTGNCVAYAEKKGKPVENLWGQWVARSSAATELRST